jgi:hypothetical protein
MRTSAYTGAGGIILAVAAELPDLQWANRAEVKGKSYGDTDSHHSAHQSPLITGMRIPQALEEREQYAQYNTAANK